MREPHKDTEIATSAAVGYKGLERFKQLAPYISHCSYDKTARFKMRREQAMHRPYIQTNRTDMLSWLVFDIDDPKGNMLDETFWEDRNLPLPNMVVGNWHDNKAHLFYAIPSVCTSTNARRGPIELARHTYKCLAKALGADEDYTNFICKTPHHSWWRTADFHDQEYELNELLDYGIEPEKKTYRQTKTHDHIMQIINGDDETWDSRNRSLWCLTRHFSYRIVDQERENGNFASFIKRVESYANKYNSADTNNAFATKGVLGLSEVGCIIRSIANWTWDTYKGYQDGKERGVMQLSKTNLSLASKQALAAKRTHAVKKDKSAKAIAIACRTLVKEKAKITLTAIAKRARLSRQTVAKFKDLIPTFCGSVSIKITSITKLIELAKMSSSAHTENVNFGGYEVTNPKGYSLMGNESAVFEGVRVGDTGT